MVDIYLKNRLRSLLGQNILIPLLLMFVEKDLFDNIEKNHIIDEIAETSKEKKIVSLM